ncbi:unnamed protein product [Prorocentrum cordatum]|uniref:Uncharacterized protein n=1 Tax=Prorocentrum cordatum TaxID=2364126 RepID=A0ABN9TJH8_9DINO|nr:unnamed protein product [Polarella glacialis]
MNEVREVSTSDIKNSEKVHMGDRSPPRRALGAAGEGEDREDSPGQGADSPPLGNLPPREQTRGRAEGRGAREEQVGRAGQWRQTAAALRAPWRRPRREEPSRLCWLVSTTTHALCSFASRVRAEDAAGRDEAAGPTRSAQWAAEGAGEARREGSGQGPRAPAAGASKGRGSRVRPYGRELAPDYLLQSSPPSFRC